MSLRVHRLGRMAYPRALALQESLVSAKLGGDRTDHLLLVEHDPVYTLGRGADEDDLAGAPARLGIPVYRVSRGGGATFHGPGQLVAYPIIQLRRGPRDIHRYVRDLEQVVVATCARFEVAACVQPGLTGVWVGEEKLASIGIGVRRGITYHGVALNVTTELAHFREIVPCRAPRLRLTSLARLLARPPTVEQVGAEFARTFTELMGYRASGAAAEAGA